jgi:hypothetical protein
MLDAGGVNTSTASSGKIFSILNELSGTTELRMDRQYNGKYGALA